MAVLSAIRLNHEALILRRSSILQYHISFLFPQHAHTEKQVHSVNNKIDIEISNLRTQYEQYRNDVIKYSIGKLFNRFSQ